MRITVLIAEDDPAMRHILRKALEEIPDTEVIGEAEDGLETVRLVKELTPQVVFLDITMPEKDGLDAAREICDFNPKTILIFATAYDNFTHQAFEVYAFDYLIKPYKIDRIRKTMERIRSNLTEAEQAENATNNPLQTSKILIKEEGKKIFVNVRDIIFLTREGRFIVIHTTRGKLKATETLEALEQKLSEHSFFRSHRGFIINLNMVKEIQPWGRKTCKVILNNTKESVIMTKPRAREMETRFRISLGYE
ncbi:LytR/AlgR family response regulator transcription factor [Pelotomaculum propionicicum]|uniref:Stage 0 sporulation protein A homolog n=1 Tax=Pelotomaculum propionicicum TaxID=258475 RepID=A0A4Y7RKJ9_9FIRM|nr:LytTR family DNA-binding domain-containing protein [Pelotomaculum propionicicum]NLI14491.1 response regulator transcription factor [Peptococcaceae bacterium]TEB09270.1 Sensory transduction protein LytR [Pelotomaculum propionicicum]